MQIKNHRLLDNEGTAVSFVDTPNRGGTITPRYLVMHYTAGSSAESSIAHMARKSAKASAHLVVGRDGSITQMVPFNRAAWHAGRSRWHELRGLNQHSIGIELDNAGVMAGGEGNWRSWFERSYADEDVLVAPHKFEDIERGWHRYTEVQIKAALACGAAICERYGIIDVLGHDDIAPERKKDPGPAFPMESFRAGLLGRSDDEPETYETNTVLNIREGPGTAYAKLDGSPLPKGTRLVSDVREGLWFFVDVLDGDGESSMTGWVHGNYITEI